MNEFENTYEDILMNIDEGAFKGLATAGLLGLSSLGASSAQSEPQPISEPARPVKNVSDASILTKALGFTKWAEGYSDIAYKDSKGVPTIGYGSNLTASHIRKELENLGYSPTSLIAKNRRIKEPDAERLLMIGLVQALKDAKQFVNNWDELDPLARMILVDMSYNLGLTRLSKFKNFKAALESKDYKTARDEMIDSKWYDDVGRRSKRLVNLMYQVDQMNQAR